MCRTEIRAKDVARMCLEPKAKCGDAADADDGGPDCMRYGTKLSAFIKFMRSQVKNKPQEKVILFI